MNHEFSKGDVVRLKSGGPHMTVQKVIDHSQNRRGPDTGFGYVCTWFAGASRARDTFDEETLEFVPEEEKKSS